MIFFQATQHNYNQQQPNQQQHFLRFLANINFRSRSGDPPWLLGSQTGYITGPEKLLPPFRPFYGLLASAEETASARTGVKVRISKKKVEKIFTWPLCAKVWMFHKGIFFERCFFFMNLVLLLTFGDFYIKPQLTHNLEVLHGDVSSSRCFPKWWLAIFSFFKRWKRWRSRRLGGSPGLKLRFLGKISMNILSFLGVPRNPLSWWLEWLGQP